MANLQNDFEFQTPLLIGCKESITVTVIGKYYPKQCNREDGVNYDIEAVLDNKDNDLINAYRACRFVEGAFSDAIDKATTAHIEYLTGYAAKEAEQSNNGIHPIFESALKQIFPKSNTYPIPADKITEAHSQFVIPERNLL